MNLATSCFWRILKRIEQTLGALAINFAISLVRVHVTDNAFMSFSWAIFIAFVTAQAIHRNLGPSHPFARPQCRSGRMALGHL